MNNPDDLGTIWVPDRRRTDVVREEPTPPRALAVDDDESYLRLLAAILTEVGFEVSAVSDGIAALKQLNERQFDLVLLDLKMPGLNGFETFDGSAAARENSYFILLTSEDALDVRLEAFNRGFNDFISKNANYLEIMAKLKAARKTVLLQRRLREEVSELKQLAMTDQLTGLANRFFFLSKARELSASGGELHLILFDLDDFKKINDQHGHLIGDRILADVGLAFRQVTRGNDVVCRFGGDEFVMLLVGVADDDILMIANRIVTQIGERRWMASRAQVNVTCSYGIASSSGRNKTLPELLSEADSNLLDRKREIHRTADLEPC